MMRLYVSENLKEYTFSYTPPVKIKTSKIGMTLNNGDSISYTSHNVGGPLFDSTFSRFIENFKSDTFKHYTMKKISIIKFNMNFSISLYSFRFKNTFRFKNNGSIYFYGIKN